MSHGLKWCSTIPCALLVLFWLPSLTKNILTYSILYFYFCAIDSKWQKKYWVLLVFLITSLNFKLPCAAAWVSWENVPWQKKTALLFYFEKVSLFWVTTMMATSAGIHQSQVTACDFSTQGFFSVQIKWGGNGCKGKAVGILFAHDVMWTKRTISVWDPSPHPTKLHANLVIRSLLKEQPKLWRDWSTFATKTG